nr:TRAP transporter small permease [Pseudomonas sp.]
MKTTLLKADAWLWRMDIALMSIAGLCVLAMMGITFVDVFMRYALHAPLPWTFDLVTQYLLIGSFFFAFSYALRTNENIVVDFFSRHLPTPLYCLLMSIGHAIIGVIFAYVVWLTAVDTYLAWENEEAFFGALVWPSWSAKIIVPLGAAALTIRLMHRSLAYWAGIRDEAFLKAVGLEHHSEPVIEEQL